MSVRFNVHPGAKMARMFSEVRILFNFPLTPQTYGVRRIFCGGRVGKSGGRGVSGGADSVFFTSLPGKPFTQKTSFR